MVEKNRLTLYMGMLYLIAILALGLIIISEKKKELAIPKVEEKMKEYIEENYLDQMQDFSTSKVKNEKNSYIMKVKNKLNEDLYFTISYQDKKITDTYQKDYVEGKTLNQSIEKELNKNLEEITKEKKNNYNKYYITYNTKLTNCTDSVRNKLLEKNYQIPIYTINVDIDIADNDNLTTLLTEINAYSKNINFIPKNYHITLNNHKNITKSMNLVIEPAIIENNIKEVVELINQNNLTALEKYNVKCNYLN